MLKKYRIQRPSIFTLTKRIVQKTQAQNTEIFNKSYFGQLNKLRNNSECKMLKV